MSMRNMLGGLVLVGGTGIATADPIWVPEEPTEYRPAEPEHMPAWKRSSDSGTFLEVGSGWMSAHPDGVTYRAQYLRFAPQVSINRWFYVGAAFQIGKVYSSRGTLNGELPAKCSVGTGLMCTGGNNDLDETTGSITEPQVFVGVRDRIGIVSGGFEIAPTLRWTTASTNYLDQSFTTTMETIEFHARADVWATPHVNAGIMVGADTSSRHDLMAGLQLGFHFEAYDDMNR